MQKVQAKIIDHLENVAQVEEREVHAIRSSSYFLLHLQVNAENEYSLDHQVDQDKPYYRGQKLAFTHPAQGIIS